MLVFAIAAALHLADPPTWHIIDQRSALDGERAYLGGVQSTGPVLTSAGRPDVARLTLNCVDRQRTVAIAWPAYLGSGDARVRWKFDDGEIQQGALMVLSGRTMVLQGRAADQFLDSVAVSQTIVLQVTEYAGQQEAVFDVTGGADVVTAVREACLEG